MSLRSFILVGILALQIAAGGHSMAMNNANPGSFPLNLTSYFNNQGFGTYPGESSFDILNQSYPASSNHAEPFYTSKTGITYIAPRYLGPSTPDNIICSGQTISLPNASSYFAVSLLHSSDVRKKTVLGNITFHYTDNTTSTAELRSEPWWAFLAINRGDITYDRFFKHNKTDFNSSHIFEFEAGLIPGKKLNAITLPNTRNETTGRIHVFAISLWGGETVGVQNVKPTQRVGENATQIVEVTINNAGHSCVHGAGLSVSINGPNITTTTPGHIKRLCPGDQKTVEVSITGSATTEITVALTHLTTNTSTTHPFPSTTLGLTPWTLSPSNLARHTAPPWFSAAKYGIFIHWGPYSVPGWGNSTPYESYAEWFWWYTTHPAADKSSFSAYRLRTYGPSLPYDAFFPNFTASAFSAAQLVDLVASAGARYFVLTTKHHDGFALFDTKNTTRRSSLHYGPRRDILREVFDAAALRHPHLKRGTYFSLPEWFNPAWGPYGFAQYNRPDSTSHPGILATNPYTNETEPYTGFVDVGDFIRDVMVPQMEMLAYDYGSDIMWCDAGAANGTARFARRWWEWARERGREVVVNGRCGAWEVNDFDTPEYETFGTAQRGKWESNRGMDPYSYGYNRATPDHEYMNASAIVTTLVDMVSKNGNLLLNIGPRADGSIPEVEVVNLQEAGKWIHAHEQAIFNTTYWFRKAEVKNGEVDVRFTQTEDAFYVLSLRKPENGVLRVDADVPILEGDNVSLLGVGEDGEGLIWDIEGGIFSIEVGGELLDKIEYCWVFKVEYLV